MKEEDLDHAKVEVVNGDALLIDVREPGEFDEERLANARNISLTAVKEARVPPELRRDKKLYCHCASGGRANTVAKMLREQGFTNVHPMPFSYATLHKHGF